MSCRQRKRHIAVQYDSHTWEKHYENIKEMRKDRNAPVDTMGCDRCVDKSLDPKIYRFQCLVSLMLSSQTKDEITYAAMEKLKLHGLTVSNILSTDDSLIGKLIYPVGFWKKKVSYLKRTAQILKEKYDEDIPKTVNELCELPGVGPKMAYLCMSIGWGISAGIGVDTHVHRIANRLNWVTTKSPEDSRLALEELLPTSLWEEINWMLVGFGQQICTPVNPKCFSCLNAAICPNAVLKKPKS